MVDMVKMKVGMCILCGKVFKVNYLGETDDVLDNTDRAKIIPMPHDFYATPQSGRVVRSFLVVITFEP